MLKGRSDSFVEDGRPSLAGRSVYVLGVEACIREGRYWAEESSSFVGFGGRYVEPCSIHRLLVLLRAYVDVDVVVVAVVALDMV